MIPNVLISKYLDGELSIEEDMEFRAMLAADSEARDAFDSAVLLHIAMRCEDDTTVPADVEERVLAFIDAVPMFASPYAPSATTYRSAVNVPVKGLRARGTAARRVLAVAAMLLVFVLPFGDQFAGLGVGLMQSNAPTSNAPTSNAPTSNAPTSNAPTSNAPTSNVPTSNVPTSNAPTNTIEVARARTTATHHEDPTVATATTIGTTLAAEPVVAVDQQLQVAAPSLHALFATKDIPVFVTNTSSSGPEPKATLFATDAPNVDVLVSTSFSQSVASPTQGAVTTVAAGIGYAVSSNTFVGMEMGSTQYTRTNETMGLVTDNPSGSFADLRGTGLKQSDHSGQLAKVTIEASNGQRYRTEIHTSLSPEGTIWGAAFVQHSVLRTGILALNGRLGAGVGEDGMLTYGRMQAECALFSGVSLTIGAEARYSPFRTGVIGRQPMARTYGTVISALYGLQVRL